VFEYGGKSKEGSLVEIVQFYAIYMLEIRRKRMGKTCQGSGFIAIR
jgi:hypothetical protein